MFCKVKEYIKRKQLLHEGDSVVLGVSGGADSVCLFYLLKELQEEYKLKLYVVHVHHGLRGVAADQDEQYVKRLCDTYKVSYKPIFVDVQKYAVENKVSSEEAGRILRYQAFQQEYIEHNCNKIAIAHHKNDIAETVLFNLSRGTGLKGLGGIADHRDNIIRPLLCCTKEEIVDYLNKGKIKFCTDATNLENIYTRNKIRNEIIPIMSQINPKAVDNIVRCSNMAQEVERYLENNTKQVYRKIVFEKNGQYFVKARELEEQDIVIQKRVVRMCISKLTRNLKDIEERHILDAVDLVHKKVGKEVHLPYGILGKREYESICFGMQYKISNKQPNEKLTEIQIDIDKAEEYIIEALGLKVKVRNFLYDGVSDYPKKECTKWFDYDRIKSTVLLRNRLQGDYIQINQGGNCKSIKKLFIDNKIPKDEREYILLLCDGKHVMWILHDRMSEAYKITKETKKILEVEVMEVRNGRSY